MKASKNDGEPLAATWGGPGFAPRERDHTGELGDLWRACGAFSEVGPLREVLLSWPGRELEVSGAPNDHLMLDRVGVDAIQAQARGIETAFAALGVQASFYRPTRPPPPNLIFMRDLFAMTPEGAVVGRLATEQRAGEERFITEALAELGIPILHTVRGRGTFEGADALWLDDGCVLLGVGRRTNEEGAATVAAVFASMGVETRSVAMPEGVQHLLGVANFIDRDLVALHADKASDELRGILREHGYELLELPPSAELLDGRGMNFVTVAPRRVLMPAACPELRRRYQEAGAEASEVDVSEYLKAAGGLACLTGILARG